MKRRFLSMLLAVTMIATMFAGFTVWADAEVVKTFIDTDIDNDTSWNPDKSTYITDTVLNSQVAKYDVSVGGGFSYTRCRNTDTLSYSNLAATGVLWGEISIKYEGAFTRFAWEHDQASPPVWIDDDGSVRTGGYNIQNRPAGEAGTDTGYDLELGKWYHIVTALDYTASTTGAITIWINGEKIVNAATPYSRLQGGKGFAYVDLKLVDAADTPSTVYLDNYRAYTTSAIDSHPENSALSDADSEDAIGIVASSITGASNADVATVKGAFTNGDKLVFVKGGSILADDANAVGATAYAPLANGKGFRTYIVAADGTQIITKKYVDINFDNWTNTTHGIDVNNVKIITDDVWMGNTSNLELSEVPEKSGISLSTPVATESDRAYFVRARVLSGSLPSTYADCGILWTEFSVKYEGGIVGFGFGESDSAYNLVSINKSGNLEIGARWGYGEVGGGSFNRGTMVSDRQLEVGKWYHIVAAVDFTDANAAESGAPFHIWLNGEKICDGTRTANVKPGSAWKYHKMWIDTAEEEGRTVYVDNLKVYETSTLDTHAAADFDIAVEDANADDNIYFEDGYIIAPKTATVADVKEAITADNYVFVKDGTVLGDNDPAQGSVMTVNASNGIGCKQYEVVWGIVKDILGPIGESAVESISASIATSNETYHPVTAMIDNVNTGDNVYKSKDSITDELVVTIKLNAYYLLDNLTIYERFMAGSDLNVNVELGKNGIYSTVATGVALADGTTHIFGTPTTITFDEREADVIRLTFNGTGPSDQAQKYQIFEIEALGVKSGDIPVYEKLTGTNGLTSFTASIPTRAGAHPVIGMIDGNREYHDSVGGTDASLYKSHAELDSNPLKVLFTFDGVYNISNVMVFERRIDQNPVTVSVLAGLNGEFTEIASDVALTPGSYTNKAKETSIIIPWTDADAVMLVFENAGDYAGEESSYQISEIEVYGEKTDDVAYTGIIPGYCYWEETNNSIVIAYANGTDADITADTFIAAYEGDKMVAVCKAREMTIVPGVAAQYSMSVNGIKQEGRTYKAFVMDSMSGLKPLMKAEIIG